MNIPSFSASTAYRPSHASARGLFPPIAEAVPPAFPVGVPPKFAGPGVPSAKVTSHFFGEKENTAEPIRQRKSQPKSRGLCLDFGLLWEREDYVESVHPAALAISPTPQRVPRGSQLITDGLLIPFLENAFPELHLIMGPVVWNPGIGTLTMLSSFAHISCTPSTGYTNIICMSCKVEGGAPE